MEPKLLGLISHQSFFSAVQSDNIDSLKLILEGSNGGEGGDPSSLMALCNDAGETPLYIAAERNLEEIVRHLVEYCDLETVMIRSKSDMDAFHVAALRGNLGVVKELLNRWPELCKFCDSTNTSPLYSAARRDHLEVVNAILHADESSVRIVRKNGKTALHNAVRYGPYRIAKALIDTDPELVCIRDKKGQTALHMSVKGRDPSIVEEILCADMSILNARDRRGNTALHIATRKYRSQIVILLLGYASLKVNAINCQNETALDLAEKLQYGGLALEIMEALVDAGAKHAMFLGPLDEGMELKSTVRDIKYDLQSQLLQNAKTDRRFSGIKKELRELHRVSVHNTTNSVTVVAVLFASIAFMAIFNLPGQYIRNGTDAGKAQIAGFIGFRVFCLLNATSLFISLAVVVIQMSLIAWETKAQKQVVSVVNKLMWAACISTSGSFLSLAFIVVGTDTYWMAITIAALGIPILVGTFASMCYFFRQRFRIFGDDSQRRIRRGGGSKSFSWSRNSGFSDPYAHESDCERIYAL